MSDPERYATCDGRALVIEWRIDAHFFYTFEVDSEAAEALVPEPLQIVEVRPGVALLSVGTLGYEPGHFGEGSPTFVELVSAVHVAPDLSVDMPVPSMSFFALKVLSSSADFVAQEARTIFTPSVHDPSLTFEIAPGRRAVRTANADGPILELENRDPEPRYLWKEMWGQHYTATRGLQNGIWEWDGRMTEHMKPDRSWTLHPHPFWGPLDPTAIRRCYRQMALEPGGRCRERFWAVRPVAR